MKFGKGKLSDEILVAITKAKAKAKAPEAESDDGDDEDEDLDVSDPASRGKAAAQELLDAIRDEDASGVYDAVKALVEMCME